jgi:RNA-directed DNA polymerase
VVKGKSSPDDPNLRDYWRKRNEAKAKDLAASYQKIARNQNHVCQVCGETLYNGEELHKHHLEPRGKGGKDSYSNFKLIHLYCHQQTHSGEAEGQRLRMS